MAMVYKASRLSMVASKAHRPSRTAMATAKETAAESTTKAARRTGLTMPSPVSPEMKKFLGVSEAPRLEAIKKIWEHVKANSLQNPANKREIICDEKLKGIFGQKENVSMFEISK